MHVSVLSTKKNSQDFEIQMHIAYLVEYKIEMLDFEIELNYAETVQWIKMKLSANAFIGKYEEHTIFV